MHMQEKNWGQKHRGPADAIEPHPFSGAGRSPGELCATSRWAQLLLLHRLVGGIPAHPGRARQKSPSPARGRRVPECRAGHAPTQRATLRRSGTGPQCRTPRWGVAGWEKPRQPWLRHGSSLWACGHMLFFWGIRSYLFVAIIHHPDHQSSLSSQMSWPWGYHEKKPHRPSVSPFNSPRIPRVQQLLVSGSIQQHPQSCCPAKTFSSHGRAISPLFFLQLIQIKGNNGKEGDYEVTNRTPANLARKILSPSTTRTFALCCTGTMPNPVGSW